MSDLMRNFSGQHMAFRANDDSANDLGVGAVLVELTDTSDGELELAFDVGNHRHYIRFLAADLRRAVRDFHY